VLVCLVVCLVANESCFVFSHGLSMVLLLLVQQANFNQSVSLAFQGEGLCQDRILEVSYGLFNLVRLCKDHAQLVKDLCLLVKVRGHFKNCNQSADCVIIGLKFLIQNSDSVPQLRILDVF